MRYDWEEQHSEGAEDDRQGYDPVTDMPVVSALPPYRLLSGSTSGAL